MHLEMLDFHLYTASIFSIKVYLPVGHQLEDTNIYQGHWL